MIGIFHYNKLFYKDILVHILRMVSRLIVSNEYAIAYLQVQSGFPVPEGDFFVISPQKKNALSAWIIGLARLYPVSHFVNQTPLAGGKMKGYCCLINKNKC